MQKQLSKVGKVSSRSVKRIAAPKAAAKKPASTLKKRAVKKSVNSQARIRNNRLSIPLTPWENRTSVVAPVSSPAPESLLTATDHTRNAPSSTPHMPWNNRAAALNTANSSTPHTLMIPVQERQSMAPPQPVILRGNQTYKRRATDVVVPQAFQATPVKFWKRSLTASLQIPSMLLSLFGWYNSQRPLQQKRMVLQMLIVSGSIRPCNVEFRYSTTPEETGSLSRSFAATPPTDIHPSTPLQMFLARSQAGGAQLIQRLRMQECYVRLYGRWIQLVERLRRELSTRANLSRI